MLGYRFTRFAATTLLIAPLMAHAQLTSVTQDGDLMVNDAALGVTWADVASPSGLFWSATAAPGSAQAWIASLNAENYGGYDNWMLPTGDGTYTTLQAIVGYGFGPSTSATQNQLGYLFVNELGNSVPPFTAENPAYLPLAHLGPFTTLNSVGNYWSSSLNSFEPGTAWFYQGVISVQGADPFGSTTDTRGNLPFMALAVRDGLVSAVPEPSTYILMLAGGAVLFGWRRRASATADLPPG